MKRRVGTRLLGSVPVLLASVLGGCYSHHTADEELLEIGFPDEVYPDGGAPVADAGSVNKCTQTDPIQLLICQVSQGGGNGFQLPGRGNNNGNGNGDGTGQTPDLQDLIDQFLGGGTGGTGNGTGTGLDGLTDIIDLIGALQGGGSGAGAGQFDLQDLIDQFTQGRRDAGAPQPPGTGTLTEEQCAKATDAATRFRCTLSGFATPPQGRRDGGTGFTWPFPVPGQAQDAGAAPVVY